jgi:CRISPR system Cascade subunit CasC
VLAERGPAQPRTLAGAFANPVAGTDLVADSIAALDSFRLALDEAYGPAAAETYVMQVGRGGRLADLIAFARG